MTWYWLWVIPILIYVAWIRFWIVEGNLKHYSSWLAIIFGPFILAGIFLLALLCIVWYLVGGFDNPGEDEWDLN